MPRNQYAAIMPPGEDADSLAKKVRAMYATGQWTGTANEKYTKGRYIDYLTVPEKIDALKFGIATFEARERITKRIAEEETRNATRNPHLKAQRSSRGTNAVKEARILPQAHQIPVQFIGRMPIIVNNTKDKDAWNARTGYLKAFDGKYDPANKIWYLLPTRWADLVATLAAEEVNARYTYHAQQASQQNQAAPAPMQIMTQADAAAARADATAQIMEIIRQHDAAEDAAQTEKGTAEPMTTPTEAQNSLSAVSAIVRDAINGDHITDAEINEIFNEKQSDIDVPAMPSPPVPSGDHAAYLEETSAYGAKLAAYNAAYVAYSQAMQAIEAARSEALVAAQAKRKAQAEARAAAEAEAAANEARAAAQAKREAARAARAAGQSSPGTEAAEGALSLVPTLDPNYTIPAAVKRLFDALAYQADTTGNPTNILMTGPAGTGKTKAAEQFAALMGIEYLAVETYLFRESRDMFGSVRAAEGKVFWQWSLFAEMLMRGNCVIALEEITRAHPSVLNALLPLLDHRRAAFIEDAKQWLTVGENVFFFASANIGAEFTGAYGRIDTALDTRFGARIETTHLSISDEADVLKIAAGLTHKRKANTLDMTGFTEHGITEADCQRIAKIASQIRAANTGATATLTETFSLRLSLAAVQMFKLIGPDSFEFTILPRFSADGSSGSAGSEREQVRGLIQGQFTH